MAQQESSASDDNSDKGMVAMTPISKQANIRLTENERGVIAAILEQNPHLGGKVSRAISWALFESQKADELHKALQATVWALKGHIDRSITFYLAEFWSEKLNGYVDRWVTIPED